MLNTIPIKQNIKTIDDTQYVVAHPFENAFRGVTFDISRDKIENNDFGTNQTVDIIKSFHSSKSTIFGNIKNDPIGEILRKDFNSVKNYSASNGPEKFLVNIDVKLRKISIYSVENQPLGYFTLEHIVKYLGDIFDSDREFLGTIDGEIYDNAKKLIRSLVVKRNYNKKEDRVNIVLVDHTMSGMMCDVETLMKLSDMLHEYISDELYVDTKNINKKNKIRIEDNIKKFYLMLMEHTLKLISVVIDKICDDKIDLKYSLVKYSSTLIQKINCYIYEQLKTIHTENVAIHNSLELNTQLKKELHDKLAMIEKYYRNISYN